MPKGKQPDHLRFDRVLTDIADYVCRPVTSRLAYQTAHLCLLDALGCGLAALGNPACARLLGPVVPGTIVPHGAKVPGTQFQLDPVTAAANIGTMIRWLDFNDTWLAAEWGHPSDNLGAILATADWLSRTRRAQGRPSLTMRDVLTALIQAYEIQGVIALENSFNRLGFDHVLLVKVASTAVAARLMGGSREQIVNALSNAWIDGPTLRVYRHAPNTGSRKSWASGDATSRAVQLALMALKGEMGYPTALTAKRWGFYDAFFAGEPFRFPQKYASYIVENILFKVSFPAEFHAQTAVECAIDLHPEVRHRLDDIDKVIITTQQSALLVIDKQGPLRNPADRDHCMQYMVAIGLLKGNIVATDYEDEASADPRIDRLRAKMTCVENKQWTRDHDDPAKRTITNGVQVFFADGAKTRQVVIEYPLGHRGRRTEATPLILAKFRENIGRRLPQQQREYVYALCQDQKEFARMAVDDFIDACVI